jgi:hypothetical protein
LVRTGVSFEAGVSSVEGASEIGLRAGVPEAISGTEELLTESSGVSLNRKDSFTFELEEAVSQDAEADQGRQRVAPLGDLAAVAPGRSHKALELQTLLDLATELLETGPDTELTSLFHELGARVRDAHAPSADL